jgi:hypothetical protein
MSGAITSARAVRGYIQNIPDWCHHLYSSCGSETAVDGRTTMYSEPVCQVARSWVDVGSFHMRLFLFLWFLTASVRNILDIRLYAFMALTGICLLCNSSLSHWYVTINLQGMVWAKHYGLWWGSLTPVVKCVVLSFYNLIHPITARNVFKHSSCPCIYLGSF